MKGISKDILTQVVAGVSVAIIMAVGTIGYVRLEKISGFSFQISVFGIFCVSVISAILSSFITFFFLRRLIAESNIDRMTGALNNNQINPMLEKRIEEAKSKNLTFGVILIDIDGFKRINDEYDHEIGNETLKQVAEIIKPRDKDEYLFRYGGDEFMIISKLGLDSRACWGFADRLRKGVAEYEFQGPINSEKSFSLTVSCGAVVSESTDSVKSIRDRVSLALKHAKQPREGCPTGKNFAFLLKTDSQTNTF